ncbi:MAG: M20/M25/M40 family metallo-hydrolase [Bdellovibrionales bacterium]|nr:M20/M25/M40 family metallo-hydrolase [Bdellovibrionales bacterium]
MLGEQALQKIFDSEIETYLQDWKTFLEFRSVSTDPEFSGDCLACANWLRSHLEEIGFATQLLETGTKPIVYGHYDAGENAPRLLFYGHYDVQPADPLDEWLSPPFTPELRDGRMYARGAQDNKGQVMYFLKAVEALIRHAKLPVSLSVLIEGEEECGSGGIGDSLEKWKDLLQSGVLMVCDTGSHASEVCGITMGLRGIAGLTVTLSGPRTDLHSGVHGGVAPNPAAEMAKLLASLYDSSGRIAVEGYYDDVAEPNPQDIEIANAFEVPDEFYRAMSGVNPVGGEKGYTFAERRGFRPTIEINGVHSGYGGAGMKTIIPRDAIAKITTRIVPDQTGSRCLELIERHLLEHAPDGLILTVEEKDVGGSPLRTSSTSAVVQKARTVLDVLPVGQVALIWEGASIPIVARLAQVSGAEPLLVGFGLEEDNIHAPNESFSLEQFRKGFLYVASFLSSFDSSS